MKIKLPVNDLKAALKVLSHVNSDIVAVNFVTGVAGAADSEIVIEHRFGGKMAGGELVYLDSKLLASAISSLNGEIEVEVKEGLTIYQGKTKLKLPLANEVNIPYSPEVVKSKQVDNLGAVLADALSILGRKDKQYSIKLEAKDGLRVVTTDNQRLLISSVESNGYEALLSERVSRILASLRDSISVEENESSYTFISGPTIIVARKTVAKFLDYERVIPVEFKAEFKVKADQMLGSLKRLAPLVSEENQTLTVSLVDGEAWLSVAGGAGEDFIPAEFLEDKSDYNEFFDDRYEIRVQHKHLLDFFGLVNGDVLIGLRGPDEPVYFEAGRIKLIVAQMNKG